MIKSLKFFFSMRLVQNLLFFFSLMGLYFLFMELEGRWEALKYHGTRQPAVIDFVLPKYPEGEVRLADYKGKPFILHFWASWCHACRQEKPVLDQVLAKAREKNEAVLGVAVSDDRDALKDFATSEAIPFTVAIDAESQISYQYKVSDIPQTFFIGANGEILKHYDRAIDEADLPEIQKILDNPVPAPKLSKNEGT